MRFSYIAGLFFFVSSSVNAAPVVLLCTDTKSGEVDKTIIDEESRSIRIEEPDEILFFQDGKKQRICDEKCGTDAIIFSFPKNGLSELFSILQKGGLINVHDPKEVNISTNMVTITKDKISFSAANDGSTVVYTIDRYSGIEAPDVSLLDSLECKASSKVF